MIDNEAMIADIWSQRIISIPELEEIDEVPKHIYCCGEFTHREDVGANSCLDALRNKKEIRRL